MPSSKGTGAAYLTKDNIVLDNNAPASKEAILEQEGVRDLNAELTGQYAGGRVLSNAQDTATYSPTTATVHVLVNGTASQSEAQVVVLPEGVAGTFTLGCNLSVAGGVDTTAALDLDAAAATIQTALDGAGANLAPNDVVVTKVPNRRILGLSWGANAAGRNVNVDPAVVVVTITESNDTDNVDIP